MTEAAASPSPTLPICIIGAGPAGLMAAQQLAQAGFTVHVYEQNKAAARKFLVAGHGGFNLTHQEDIALFVSRYTAAPIQEMVHAFTNKDTVHWLAQLGIDTYVGSSGKIFPAKSIKPIQVLQAWLDRLKALGVRFFYQHQLIDFDQQQVILNHQGNTLTHPYSRLILGLGGGSWPKTGSDAKWVPMLQEHHLAIEPLEAANAGYNSVNDYSLLEGQHLKNIIVRYGAVSKAGELVFTSYGIEGSPLYFLNRYTRRQQWPLTLHIDLKPTQSEDSLREMLKAAKNISKTLKEHVKLAPAALQLVKMLDKECFTNAERLAQHIKSYPIAVSSLRPLAEVISTAGGLRFDQLQADLSLKNMPQVHCIGEMLDWEAPTGGYLLQACFSSGVWVARAIMQQNV